MACFVQCWSISINRKDSKVSEKIKFSNLNLTDIFLWIFFIHFRPFPSDTKLVKKWVWTTKVEGRRGTKSLLVRPLTKKKHFFMCVFPYLVLIKVVIIIWAIIFFSQRIPSLEYYLPLMYIDISRWFHNTSCILHNAKTLNNLRTVHGQVYRILHILIRRTYK